MNDKTKNHNLLIIGIILWTIGFMFTYGMLNFDFRVSEYFLSKFSNVVDIIYVFTLWPSILGYLIVYFFH